jgi:hypothetical protein
MSSARKQTAKAAFEIGIERGEIQSPPPPKLSVAGQGSSAMPAWRPGMQITLKIVNVFDGNVGIGLPNQRRRCDGLVILAQIAGADQ